MRKHTRTAIASLVALVAFATTALPANAFGFLMPTRYSMKTIERLAPYVPQSTCNPTAKIGTRSVLALLERKYPGTGSDGISRACSSGGRSEHKEGRALDWAVNYYNAKQRVQASNAVYFLLKKDRMGRPYANARRLGVMYIIWNRQIWSASHPGWRPYSGRSQHRDHMHISLSWAGALGKTSYWTGKTLRTPVAVPVAPVTPTPAATTPTTTTPTTTTPTTTSSPSETASTSTSPSAPTSTQTDTKLVTSGHGQNTGYGEERD